MEKKNRQQPGDTRKNGIREGSEGNMIVAPERTGAQ